jgi:hypothetical protein
MSYAKLNIWLRDLDCSPKNVWKVELVVKTCTGEYLVDFNPDVLDKLKETYPHYSISTGSRDGETTINIRNTTIKHIEVDVPPGCYIVRAWVCSGNLWTDRAMVIVRCGDDGCVNLVVPEKENCIKGVMIPIGLAAYKLRLKPELVRPAIEVLLRTGRLHREDLLKEITDLTGELKESEAKEAGEYVRGLEFTHKVVKGVRLEDD